MQIRLAAFAGLTALGAATLLGGCSNAHEARAREYRSDPTPALTTLYQRESDVKNDLTITFDENFRMFNQDLGRFWYTNRPSRLTPEPIPRH